MALRLARPLELLHVSDLCEEPAPLSRARALRSALGPDVAGDGVLRVEVGLPQDRLIEATQRSAVLVLGCGGAGGLPRARAATTTLAVIRAAAAPVVVVPRRVARRGPATLTRGGALCAVRDDSDLAVAGTAACWARELGLRLTLVHVVSPRRLPVTPLGGPPPTGLLYGDRDQVWAARAMLGEMARAVAPTAPTGCASGVLVGAVGAELARLTADEGCALLVVGPARPRSVAWRFRRQTVAYVTRHARGPVLVTPAPEVALAGQRSPVAQGSTSPRRIA